MGDIIPFPVPEKRGYVGTRYVPNLVQWLESLGFRFALRDQLIEVTCPDEMGLDLPAYYDQEAIAEAIVARMHADRSLWEPVYQYLELRNTNADLRRRSVFSGGPLDGQPISPSAYRETFCINIRRAWWAVYRREGAASLAAKFVGYATSEAKGYAGDLAVKAAR